MDNQPLSLRARIEALEMENAKLRAGQEELGRRWSDFVDRIIGEVHRLGVRAGL